MTKSNCDVCCGRGKIRVPIYGRMSVAEFNPLESMSMRESSREYPCPECSEVVPVERIAVIKQDGLAFSQYENDPRFIESVKGELAHRLVDELVERGLVKFERGPTDDREMRFGMRLSTAVVAPSQVAAMQDRVARHQEALAREVMAEAKRQINNWGSHYGNENLAKAQARDSVDSALKSVLEARATWRAA